MKAVLKKDKHPYKKGEVFALHGTVFTNGESCLSMDIVLTDVDFELSESTNDVLSAFRTN